ncbi:MAG TPA: histidine phosphatase family protein [Nitriliruptorales bacterium]
MELILIRHAQPAWAEPDGTAVNDPGLTDLGRLQAQTIAARLATLSYDGPTELLVSTARRARQTAEPIAEAMGLEATHHDWIHEIRLPPDWEGTPAQEVGRRLRDARARPRDQWWIGLGQGSESFRDFHERVTTGLEGALAERDVTRHPDDPEHLWSVPEHAGRLVIVAHAGTNSVVLSHLLGIAPQPWEWERFASNHASFTILDTTPIASGSIWSLQLFSGVAHIADEVEVTK